MDMAIAVATRSLAVLAQRLWKQFANVIRALPRQVLPRRSWSCESLRNDMSTRVLSELRHLALWLSTEARAPVIRCALQTALVSAVTRNAPPRAAA